MQRRYIHIILFFIIFLCCTASVISIAADDDYNRAIKLSETNKMEAIRICEKAINSNPNDAGVAKFYLLVGKLKRDVERTVEKDYAEKHLNEYKHDHISDSYLYTGKHFKELISKFPQSNLRDDAAYELTMLTMGGECEGFVECPIRREFNRVKEFFVQYPNSKFTERALDRVNDSFISNLAEAENNGDYISPNEYYDPDSIKQTLTSYEEIVANLPKELRAKAYETIAELWEKFHEYERARKLYNFIVSNVGNYKNIASIRARLSSMPSVEVRLSPANVVSYSRVDLRWDHPEIKDARGYVVYRTTESPERLEWTKITNSLSLNQTEYSDRTVRPDTNYWYRVALINVGKDIYSNSVHCKTDATLIKPMDIVFNKKDNSLYVFGFLQSGTPEIMQIFTNGKKTSRIHGTFIGSPRRFGSQHDRDLYSDEIWFMDPSNHLVQGFNKFDPKLVDYLSKGQEFQSFLSRMSESAQGETSSPQLSPKGKKIKSYSMTGIPEYGYISTISLTQKKMWVVPRYSSEGIPFWDDRNGLIWVVKRGLISLHNPDGSMIRSFVISKEFSQLFLDKDKNAVWGFSHNYKENKGSLTKINQNGSVLAEISFNISPFARQIMPVDLDVSRNALWYLDYEYPNYLVKYDLRGTQIYRIPLNKILEKNYYDEKAIAVDESTGNIWVMGREEVVQLNSSAEPISRVSLK